jgi:hypothetical protein
MTNSIAANKSHPVTRLTALWALNECGLGGLMFALKIPFTGIFVGGFAMVLIGLIAHYSHYDYRKIFRATVLVLIAKATVSPHSPPPAYLAVAFQGLLGALMYAGIRNFTLASLLLAMVAMLESAMQKLIVLTLVYGKSIWVALNQFYGNIASDFSLPASSGFSYWLIGLYLLLYAAWGLLVGLFIAKLPRLIDTHADTILQYYKQYRDTGTPPEVKTPQQKKKIRFLGFALILLFIIVVFVFSNQYKSYALLYVVVRSLAAIFLLFFVLRPVLTLLLQRWLKSRDEQTRQEAAEIIGMMPSLRRFIRPAWQLARVHAGRTGRLRYFVLSMVIFTLNEK